MDPIQRPKPPLPSYYAGTSLLSYASQWKDHYQRSTSGEQVDYAATTTFGLAFFSERSDSQWLLGCTSEGEVCVWKLADPSPNVTDDEAFESRPSSDDTVPTSRPVVRLKISKGVLYACKMVKRPNGYWLVVSGDDGKRA
jgi:hypothetical protein